MNKEEQIKIINETIAKTKFTLKPLGYNFIFWGFLIISMSLFHYFFPEIVQFNVYSAVIYWVLIPLLGMIYTTYYNIKIVKKIGYETILGRVIKIIWGVFGGSWIAIVTISFYLETYDNPAQDILFLLGVTLTMS